MEGRFVAHTFERLLSQVKAGADEIEKIREAIKSAEELCDALGFCLSEKPDLLSQWRGYADDGQGFSIGFSKGYLEKLPGVIGSNKQSFKLKKVLYNTSEHEDALRPAFEKIKNIVESGKLKFPMRSLLSDTSDEEFSKRKEEYLLSFKMLWLEAATTLSCAYTLKNPAFSEEIEWRLLSYMLRDSGDSALFRAASNRLIPYREFSLEALPEKSISEVYIGPKNITPTYIVEKFLALNGFQDVSVKRSSATYR